MVQRCGGDERKRQQLLVNSVARVLEVTLTNLSKTERRVFSDFALALAMIPDLSRWSKDEKTAIRRICRAKAGPDESRYVRLSQSHQKLRDGLRKLGSREATG
jgi:hypothetical protein